MNYSWSKKHHHFSAQC